jgi:thiol-disulfide isomerase/thioredoxin
MCLIMKKFSLFVVTALTALSLSAQTVTFSSKTPVAGVPLSFTYNPSGGKLAGLAGVKCVAYTFVNTKQKVVNVPLIKEGEAYKGTFTPIDSTAIAVITFSADGTKDENPNGYYTLFYKGDRPTAMAYYWEAQFYNGMGSAFAGVNADRTKAIAALEKSFELDPSFKSKYLINYMNLQYGLDKVKGAELVKAQIALLNQLPSAKEEDLTKIASLYTILKQKASADSVYNLVKAKYPKGSYAYGQAANGVYNEKDADKKVEKLGALIKAFDLDPRKKVDADKIEGFYGQIANAYAAVKNNDKFKEYAGKVTNKMTLAAIYNSFAWPNAEKKENLVFASEISKKSLDLIEQAKNDPMPSFYASREDYLKGLESNYAMYADTYALLLHHLGKNEEALKYQEIAVKHNEFGDNEMNGRYVTFLARAGRANDVVTYAERFIKDGQGTAQMKDDLKSAYRGAQSFDVYYAGLEKDAAEKERAKFMKEMINMPAPKFALTNLKGETVSLAALKGKVVIVDYWATWCGPCIASFPGMQKAVDKYKNDPNVAFLFVNTWQTEENREKVVRDWVAANPTYTFNVLLDTKNPKDPSKFEVIEQYKVEGIPTKFIVDGNGNIRFKKVGFSGSAEGTVRELDLMIALAKGGKEASK